MDLEVVIEGVSDVGVEQEIKWQIEKLCKDATSFGEWSVFVSPSERRGEWDLLVRGPFGRHIASFTEPVDQLPVLVAEQLRHCLSVGVNA
jgi:hypothetical protein